MTQRTDGGLAVLDNPCPPWCNSHAVADPGDMWHSGANTYLPTTGTPGGRADVEVFANEFHNGSVVTERSVCVTVNAADTDLMDMSPERARQLAAALNRAADALDPRRYVLGGLGGGA